MKIKRLSYLFHETTLKAAFYLRRTQREGEAGTRKADADYIIALTVKDDLGQTGADVTEDGLRFSFSAEDAGRIGLYLNYPANDWTDQNPLFRSRELADKGWVDFKAGVFLDICHPRKAECLRLLPVRRKRSPGMGTTDPAVACGRVEQLGRYARNLEVGQTATGYRRRLFTRSGKILCTGGVRPPRWSTMRTILPR